MLPVRDGTPNTDAEHRVPTGLGRYALPNFVTAPILVQGGMLAAHDPFEAVAAAIQSEICAKMPERGATSSFSGEKPALARTA